MHLFITGANSFVGTSLVAHCQQHGIPYSGIDRVGPFGDGIVERDLRMPDLAELIPEGSVVVHLAAVSRDSDCAFDPRGAMDINITATARVVQNSIRAGALRLVFASSEWVYGRLPASETLAEHNGPDWANLDSLYATSKAAGEHIVTSADGSLPSTILRFAIVYGPRAGNWSAFEAVTKGALDGVVKVGSARTSRRFIHVRDICSGIVAAAHDVGLASHIWNLAGPSLVSLGEIAQTAATLLGREVAVVESDPDAPSIRNPLPNLMMAESSWSPHWSTEDGVRDVLSFLGVERLVREDQDNDRLVN